MVICGFSLGAQVALTALSNPELQQQHEQPGKYRVAIIAPALNSHFVNSELACYPCNPIVKQTEVFLNRLDCPVKVSQTIARRRTKSEFSVRDIAGDGRLNCNSIAIRDITREVSRRHSVVSYGRSKCMSFKLAEMLNSTFEKSCSSQSEIAYELDGEKGKQEGEPSQAVISATVVSSPESDNEQSE